MANEDAMGRYWKKYGNSQQCTSPASETAIITICVVANDTVISQSEKHLISLAKELLDTQKCMLGMTVFIHSDPKDHSSQYLCSMSINYTICLDQQFVILIVMVILLQNNSQIHKRQCTKYVSNKQIYILEEQYRTVILLKPGRSVWRTTTIASSIATTTTTTTSPWWSTSMLHNYPAHICNILCTVWKL